MKKTLMALVVTAAITMSSTAAYAAGTTTGSLANSSNTTVSSTVVSTKDTATKISLDDLTKLSVSLQSNSLVFGSDPTRESYDSVRIYLIGKKSGILTYTFAKGQVNGATINLNTLADDSYSLRVLELAQGVGNSVRKYAFTVEVSGGNASFKLLDYYAENLKTTANERTDAYALDEYKGNPEAAYVKEAKLITTGITDDYLKAKAIANWVSSNMTYSYDGSPEELFPGSDIGNTSICGGFAGVTAELFQAAGFPAKVVYGGLTGDSQGHAWNEVYVDNRWVFADTVGFTFDETMAEWSVDHELDADTADAKVWNGSLYIVQSISDKVLKEVPKFTLGGLVTSTYGYKASDMYSDAQCTKPWNFAKDTVSSAKRYIYVKAYTVEFDCQGGIGVEPVTVNANSTVTKPAETPTRKGYKFAGWYKDRKCTQRWNFATDKVTADTVIYAGWYK